MFCFIFLDGYKGDIALTAEEYEREVIYYKQYKKNLRKLREEQRSNRTSSRPKDGRKTHKRRHQHKKTTGEFIGCSTKYMESQYIVHFTVWANVLI